LDVEIVLRKVDCCYGCRFRMDTRKPSCMKHVGLVIYYNTVCDDFAYGKRACFKCKERNATTRMGTCQECHDWLLEDAKKDNI